MRLLIHDLDGQEPGEIFPHMDESVHAIKAKSENAGCAGCFGCWTKTPAVCVIHDEFQNIGELLSKSSELLIISECYYGGYSPELKAVIDRSISYLLPYFTIRNNEMHHTSRYPNKLTLTVRMYGSGITDDEREIAKQLVAANALNFNASHSPVRFYSSPEQMRGESL